MYWFIGGIIALLLGILYKVTNGKFGTRKVVDGTITKIDYAAKKLYIQYQPYPGSSPITAEFTDKDSDFSKLIAGTKVLVTVNNSDPANPIVACYNKRSKDRSLSGSAKAAFIIAAVCFVMGIKSIIGL